LRRTMQELIPRGYTPEQAGEILDETKRILGSDRIAEIMAQYPA